MAIVLVGHAANKLTMPIEPVSSIGTDQSAAGKAWVFARCSRVHLYS
jgi:hypothetical protein